MATSWRDRFQHPSCAREKEIEIGKEREGGEGRRYEKNERRWEQTMVTVTVVVVVVVVVEDARRVSLIFTFSSCRRFDDDKRNER